MASHETNPQFTAGRVPSFRDCEGKEADLIYQVRIPDGEDVFIFILQELQAARSKSLEEFEAHMGQEMSCGEAE